MRLLSLLLGLAVFFTLFAFALNNGEPATVHWFFGFAWHAPMVVIVLVTFIAGCLFGMFGMLPSWWKHRRGARRRVSAPPPAPTVSPPASDFGPEHPPRDGL